MRNKSAQRRFADLQTRMRACRLCLEAGYFIEPPAVAKGSPDAKIMTIGQAPGITEVKAGRPFNATSGTRLFKWLGEAGIDEDWFRRTQYMTAVTKCFPGKNKTGNGDRAPSQREQALCRPYLDEELALVNPQLIIPIGRLAIEVFYGHGIKLEEIIGTQKKDADRWIIPFPHPSGASRWHQLAENRERISKAIRLAAKQYRRLFPELVSR
ncbi:MAG: uracil-DNA glycosylase family protein [Anaerolineales bacterium]